MKRILLSLTVLVSITMFVSPSFAAWSITESRHNFSNSNAANTISTTGTTEVCIFCHTPHAARTQVAAPLWNRQVSTDINATQAYSMYKSPTMQSDTGTQPDGVSLACLSCHDGTVALDAIVNAPGSGGLRAVAGGTASMGWDFVRGSDATYDLINTAGANTPADTSAFIAGSTNRISLITGDQYIPFLGTDLRNDHPISMNYAGAVTNSGNQTSAADTKFVTGIKVNGFVALVGNEAGGFGSAVTATSTVTDGTIRLFSSAGNSSNYKVQCASCHNPHGTQDSLNSATPYPTFLQQSNDSSALCIACHVK